LAATNKTEEFIFNGELAFEEKLWAAAAESNLAQF
jgi:hypothetical protein